MDLPEGRTVRRGSLGGDDDLSGDFEQWYLHQFNAPEEEGNDPLQRTNSALKLVASKEKGAEMSYSLETVTSTEADETQVFEQEPASSEQAEEGIDEKEQMVAEIMELIAAGAIDNEKGEELIARLDVTPQPTSEPEKKEKRRLSVYSQFAESGQMPTDELAFEELVLKQANILCETSEREEILQGEVSIKSEKLQLAGEMLQVLQEQAQEANEQLNLLDDECAGLACSLQQAETGRDELQAKTKQLENECAAMRQQRQEGATKNAQQEARCVEIEEKNEKLTVLTKALEGASSIRHHPTCSSLRKNCKLPPPPPIRSMLTSSLCSARRRDGRNDQETCCCS
jgi:hypothetical protein